ncbi:Spo0E family sporulation regulatory protein-aspartic acid phosphatase [Fictibacillus aquaticus]|uniref:Spo0E family sporulation regulatory protein-aspartic acid phosphatase n=1 Tax=Fictibacillus aquaticus TaxID=2021314 RepID=UPI00197AAEE5
MNLDSLHEKINHKIEELQELSVMVDRLTDPRMVTLSQELDQLILEYQHFLISKKSPSS